MERQVRRSRIFCLALRLLLTAAAVDPLRTEKSKPARIFAFEQNGSDPVRSPGPSPLDGPGGYFCAAIPAYIKVMSIGSSPSRESIRSH